MENLTLTSQRYDEAVEGLDPLISQDADDQWYEYVKSLDEVHQITYMIVELNSQVMNGGFHQYFTNGYGQFAIMTIPALNKIGALNQANLLKEAYAIMNPENLDDKMFRHKILNYEIGDFADDDPAWGEIQALSVAFFKNGYDEIEILLEKFLYNFPDEHD